jgi:hypothetical protein
MFALWLGPAIATAQTAESLRADSAFQRQDWPTSAALYRGVVQRDTANGPAWYRLGVSLESQRNFSGAADAYQHAAALRFQPKVAELGVSRSYAGMNDTPQALAHLRNAAVFGFSSEEIADDPGLASLRRQPEFPAILQAAEAARFPCRRQHEFDYWEGTFSVTPWDQPDTPSLGTATNTRLYEGCVFIEKWDGGPANRGMSMVIYDVSRHAWRMLWNDDRNGSNDFEGHYRDGAMRFSGWVLNAAGQKILTSNVLMDVSPDVIHHIFSTSADSGRTWTIRSSSRWTRQRKP